MYAHSQQRYELADLNLTYIMLLSEMEIWLCEMGVHNVEHVL